MDFGITNVANTLAGAGTGSTTATATTANTTPPPVPIPNYSNPLPVSTTTLSSGNKVSQVPAIQNKTSQLATSTGVKTNASGTPVYANGTIYGFGDGSTYDVNGNQISGPTSTGNSNTSNNNSTTDNPSPTSTSTTATGGYNGEVYVPPGGTIPLGADGKPVALTNTSPTDDKILKSLNDAKAAADAMTATIIDSIKTQYAGLIDAQKQNNSSAEGRVNTALLMGGVTGQGSSSQFAPISSSGIIQSQVTYGLSQLADLQNKEQQAIVAAQQAGQNADFQLMDKINTQISKIRDEQVAAATKLNDTVTAAKSQANLDSAVTKLYSSGTTDVPGILTALGKQGLKDQNGVPYSADEINKVVQTISTQTQNQKDVNAIALEAAKNGADAATLTKINSAPNQQQALIAAGSYITDILGNQIKKAQLQGILLDNAKKVADARTTNSSNVTISNTVTGNPAKIPTDVAPYINTSTNGVMYADLSAVQGTAGEKKKIIDEAQAAGLKVILNKNTAADLVNIQDANSKLDTIAGIMDGIAQPNWLARDLGGLGLTKLAKLAESNPQKAAAGSLESVGLDMLKAISGVQGFRGNASVVAQITEHLPKITDTKDTANQKINYIRQLITDRENAAVGTGSSNSTADTTVMTGPDGKQYNVPNDQVNAFIKAGGHK